MSVFDRHPRLRWAVPATAGLVIAAGAAVGTAGVSADSGLPPITADELLVALQTPKADAMSGTVEMTTDLGLPALPVGGASGAGLTSLASGTNTLRLWADGDGRTRVDLLSRQGEYDIIRNGRDVWVWDSSARTVEHAVLDDKAAPEKPSGMDGSLPSTPQEAADLVLASVDDTTDVAVSGAGSVAGRAVYELSLTPRQDGTKVERAVLAVDAETHVPLRVQVYSAQTQAPAIDVGFTSVDFSAPDPAVFAFVPPPGAEVTEMAADKPAAPGSGTRPEGPRPTVVGEGWTSVMIAELPEGDPISTDDGAVASAESVMMALPEVSGAWGSGRVLDGTLFSVILTDDGRMAIGAVSTELLEAALATA